MANGPLLEFGTTLNDQKDYQEQEDFASRVAEIWIKLLGFSFSVRCVVRDLLLLMGVVVLVTGLVRGD